MVISHFGVKGMQAHLRDSIGKADRLRAKIAARPDLFEMPVKTDLGLVVSGEGESSVRYSISLCFSASLLLCLSASLPLCLSASLPLLLLLSLSLKFYPSHHLTISLSH